MYKIGDRVIITADCGQYGSTGTVAFINYADELILFDFDKPYVNGYGEFTERLWISEDWIEPYKDKIKVVLDNGAYMPEKAHDTDAGFDMRTPIDFEVPNAESLCVAAPYDFRNYAKAGMATIDTGVHIELPKGTVGMIKSKSGLNVKHSLITEGVIDVGYTGSIVVKIYNLSNKPYMFTKGDKIAQLVIMPIVDKELEQVDVLQETERGNGGFGSTGK